MIRTILAAWFVLPLASNPLAAQGVGEGLLPPRPAATAVLDALPPETEAVLRIDGEPIPWGQYARWLVRTVGERQAIEYALDYYVVEREAAQRQVELAPGEVDSHVQRDLAQRILHAFHGEREEWLDELRRTGRSEDGVRAERGTEARRELLARSLAALERVVPEHKIVREWERIYGRHGRRYELRMMKFKVEVPAPEKFSRDEWRERERQAKQESLARADAARKLLVAGADFETLAQELSEDPDTRMHRGRPGSGFRDPGWPWGFLDALEALQPGQLSAPLYAKGGWWLVKLVSLDVTPLERVRHELELALIAAGPEPDEIGAVEQRLKEGVHWRVLPAMNADGPLGERPDLADPVLAIDGEPVAKGTYAHFLCRMQGETMLTGFVESWLVQKRARELGVQATREEAEARARAYIEDLVQNSQTGTREGWEEYLEQGGRDPEALFREYTFRSLTDVLTEKLIQAERTITPERLRQYFEDVYGKEGERLELRLIALRDEAQELPPGLSREQLDQRAEAAAQKTQARARELLSRVRAGEDFAALARSESCDARTRSAGGRLQERFREDRWSHEVFAAVRAAKAGDLVGPLRQGGESFVFQVVAREPVRFEEVSKDLETELLQQRPNMVEIAAFRNSLRQKAAIEILPALVR